MSKRSGIASVVVVVLIAAGLIGGATAGYVFREPLKKMIQGVSTAEEIENAVNDAVGQGKNKFELEGTTSAVDVASKTITVKIKSSTNSIKEMQLSEAPVKIADTAKIQSGNQKNLKIGDIPINSQVHIGGTIANGVLTADKVTIQKEDVDEQGENKNKEKKFEVSGTVKSVGTSSVTVTVTAANKKANSQKGKDLEISVVSTTVIEKDDVTIALGGIKAGDQVDIEGIVENDAYTASKIEIDVKEEGETIKDNEGSDESEASPSASAQSNGNSDRSDNPNSNRNNNHETD